MVKFYSWLISYNREIFCWNEDKKNHYLNLSCYFYIIVQMEMFFHIFWYKRMEQSFYWTLVLFLIPMFGQNRLIYRLFEGIVFPILTFCSVKKIARIWNKNVFICQRKKQVKRNIVDNSDHYQVKMLISSFWDARLEMRTIGPSLPVHVISFGKKFPKKGLLTDGVFFLFLFLVPSNHAVFKSGVH